MRMKRLFLYLLCVSITIGFVCMSSAEAVSSEAKMQTHIEKVKVKKPAQYKAMYEKANGSITDCVSCHIDSDRKKNSEKNKYHKYR